MSGQEPLDDQTPPPMAQSVPPIMPQPYPTPQPPQSRWPTVLGIIAIIWGGFGILGAIWALVIRLIPSLATAAASQPSPLPRSVETISGIINMALAVLLLIGGIKLLGRRILGVRLLKTWAVIDIITTVGGIVLAATGISQMLQDMQQNGAPSPLPQGAMEMIIFGGMCIGLVMGLAPPVFVLIWFARRKIKDEVATWA